MINVLLYVILFLGGYGSLGAMQPSHTCADAATNLRASQEKLSNMLANAESFLAQQHETTDVSANMDILFVYFQAQRQLVDALSKRMPTPIVTRAVETQTDFQRATFYKWFSSVALALTIFFGVIKICIAQDKKVLTEPQLLPEVPWCMLSF